MGFGCSKEWKTHGSQCKVVKKAAIATRVSQTYTVFFVRISCVHVTIAIDEPGEPCQTDRDDATKIACDHGYFLLVQVCHQMTGDDRQSAVSSCWMLLILRWSSCHLARSSVPYSRLLLLERMYFHVQELKHVSAASLLEPTNDIDKHTEHIL